ncbi:MAG: ParB/RepB/Spo0J family partition protein, partial [Gemmataceae bacterium]
LSRASLAARSASVSAEAVMREWDEAEVRPLPVEALGERYRRYRLADPAAEEAMARSLRRYGQLSPVVVCLRDEKPELIDGFKRRAAAPLAGMRTLSARVVQIDDYLGDPPLAMALLDRLVDGAIVLKFQGRSYRSRRDRDGDQE